MVFADLLYLYTFFCVTLILYFITKSIKIKNAVLIIASFFFYAWGEPLYVFLLLASTVVNYIAGILIGKYRSKGKLIVTIALIYNFAILGVFKYTGFIVENINAVFGTSISDPKIVLPIGISFFTFQIASYVIDCYWEKVEPQKNFFNLLLYISLFPQLIAGPIVRYQTIAEEIENRHTSITDFSEGITRFIVGLSKKAIIANSLYMIADKFFMYDAKNKIYEIEKAPVLGLWLGVICFSLYVYFDFSGYSDMAIGMGRIFGFHFDENFIYPFASKSISEYWQRWHISLGTFFRDYLLYVPIFGKRRKYGGLFLVWLCTGIWHGAHWNYIIWGLYFGLFVFIETLIGKKRVKKAPKPLAHIYTLLVVVIGFGIFKFENLTDLGLFFKGLVGANQNAFFNDAVSYNLLSNIFMIIIAAIISMPVLPKIKELFSKTETSVATAQTITIITNVALLVLSSIMLVDGTNNPFMYFRF